MIKINGIARLLPISVGVFNRPQFPEGAAILNCIGSRLPLAAAARMRDASFTYIEDVRLALGRMVATSSSADWWSIEDKFELIAASCELSIFQSRSAPLESRLPAAWHRLLLFKRAPRFEEKATSAFGIGH
jgi:hypothetical protein